jgi:hypothetical protein
MHHSRCQWCKAQVYVPLRRSRLEAGPWRLTWRCDVCGKQARTRVADGIVGTLLEQDRVHGMAISRREVEDFADADLDELAAAVDAELT